MQRRGPALLVRQVEREEARGARRERLHTGHGETGRRRGPPSASKAVLATRPISFSGR